jgi:hypothetical protein
VIILRNQLQDSLSLFVDNLDAIRNDFVWHGGNVKRLAALVYTMERKKIDVNAIKDSFDMIKSEVWVFSGFRGLLKVYMAASLSLSEDPKQSFEEATQVYRELKRDGFWTSEFLALVSIEIALNADKEYHSYIINRSREFYRELKANHRYAIGRDNYIIATMLAFSDLDPHQASNKIKQVYQLVRSNFSFFMSKPCMIKLSKMLVLGDNPEESVYNVLRLNRNLRQHKIRLDRAYTLPSLGALGMLSIEHDDLANDILEAINYLRAQKGLGALSVGRQELLLYAVSLIVCAYANNKVDTLGSDVTTSIVNIVIAQQVAMLAAVISASVTTSAR